MRYICIDPGTTATGLVCMTGGGEFMAARTIVIRESVGTDNDALARRCARISDDVLMAAGEWHCTEAIIEGFVPFASRDRANINIIQTPALAIHLMCELARAFGRWEAVHVQYSGDVLGWTRLHSICYGARDRVEAERMKRDRIAGRTGALLITNEHLRSAACHGLYYLKWGV